MRPLGEIARAMVEHAATPAPVRVLCERAQVGYDVGRYTASRLVQRGLLILASADEAPRPTGRGRPPQLLRAAPQTEPDEGDALALLHRSFWDRPTALEWDAL